VKKLSKEEQDKAITLDDVEVAIQILEHFNAKMLRAKNVLQRLNLTAKGGYGSNIQNPMGLSFDDIVRASIAVKQREKGGTEEQEDVGVMSQEDILKAKELVNKVRKKEVTTP
jgi:hypothetical protein